MKTECKCIADTAVTFQWGGHEFTSSGGKDRVGIRSLSEIALFDFDMALVKGTVLRATLTLTCPPELECQLPYATVSTIRAPWVEGDAKDYELCVGASSFQYRQTATEKSGLPWAWRGSLFPDVVLGRGGSVWFSQKLPDQGRMNQARKISIDIPAAVIERCRQGFSHGFAVFDDRGARDIFTRPYSRHTSTPPVLVVEVAAEMASGAAPEPVAVTALTAVAEDISTDTDAAVLVSGETTLAGHCPAIGYRAKIGANEANAKDLELWRVPEPPGEAKTAEFDLFEWELHPGDQLFVRAVDSQGRASAATTVALKPKILPAKTVEIAPLPVHLSELGIARVGVLLPGDSIRGDGKLLGASRDQAEAIQVLWKEGDPALKLEALAGEILDLPVVLQAKGANAAWSIADGAGLSVEAGRGAFVQGEFGASPDSVALLAAGAAVKLEQAAELFYFDLTVAPGKATKKSRTLKPVLSIVLNGQAVQLPLEIKVLPCALPQTTSFVVELNSYNKFHRYYKAEGDFAAKEWEIQLDYHRQAHRHRCNFNVLPYSQMGTVLCDSAPVLGENGHIADWSAWDQRYLPLLTGAAFTDGPRKGIPVTYFYLPVHENWPGEMRADYRYDLPIGDTREDYLKALREHSTIAPPIEQGFEPRFAKKLEQATFEFSRHLAEQKLGEGQPGGPILINYFNNKHMYKDPKLVEGVNARVGNLAGTSWWLLDEPNDWSDYLALKWFGDIARDGYRRGGARIEWCLDLSRVEWDRDVLRGQRDLVRVSAAFFKYPRLLKRWKKQGSIVLHYGSANSPEVKPLRETVWAWQIWSRGGEGILPWSSTPMEGFSDGGWLSRPDKLSVIVPVHEKRQGPMTGTPLPDGNEKGTAETVAWSRPSLRLKAFRRGQQDAEICALLAARGAGRTVVGREVLKHLGAVKTQAGTFIDEATSIESPDLTAQKLEGLRRAVRRLAAGI